MDLEYQTEKSYGPWYGLVVGGSVFGFCLWGIHFALGENDQVLRLMLVIPALLMLFAYLIFLWSAFTIRYQSDDKGFIIKAGVRKIFIPFAEVHDVIDVRGQSNIFSIIGINWPGIRLGLFTVRGIGPIRFYATKTDSGFIYLKSSQGFIAITPAQDQYNQVLQLLSEKSGQEIQVVDMMNIPAELKGENAHEDSFYRLMIYINIIALVLYGLYLGIFFPGSGAPNFIILLMVLALALFFFNIGNAERLYQFSSNGGYILLAVGILVTGIFFILSLSEIHL